MKKKLEYFLRQWRRMLRTKKPIKLFISTERSMKPEDEKVIRGLLFDEDFKLIEKSIIIRIGERMDVALHPSTSDTDRKACIECIEELKDIMLEWHGIREEANEEQEDNAS
jgi:hypothetical protein